MEALMRDVLVADDHNSASDNGSVKTTFPEFPSEKPTKSQKINWIESWTEDLNNSGYSALLRGEVPFEIAKLADRPAL